LPEKPLQDLAGKPLVVRVVENLAPLSAAGATVVVATDAVKIVQVCEKFQIKAVMTALSHPSGTDRCWELAQKSDKPYILNVQGDEPFVPIRDLQELMLTFSTAKIWSMGTLAHFVTDLRMMNNPAVVKVVRSGERGIYFTRAPAPWNRDRPDTGEFWQHVGVYAYRRAALERFCSLPPSPLEKAESLEQLRAIEAQMPILICNATRAPKGIDTLEDLEAARALF
jgi:3-deoxy-manno-octulosonate cytidylyltransferase (CMP-KDO synthetase)